MDDPGDVAIFVHLDAGDVTLGGVRLGDMLLEELYGTLVATCVAGHA